MIECPICHVSNEDRSLFCAECGQRFPQVSSSNEASTSPLLKPPSPDAIPRRPSVKLNSPMLGGASDRAQAPESSYGFQSSPLSSMNSPVAGESDKVENNTPSPSDSSVSGSNRRGLRSPLLEGFEESEAPQSAFPHRQNENPPQAPSDSKPVRPNKVLRSPLLSGGYEDEEEEIPPRSQPIKPKDTAGFDRRQRLHSPVLDGAMGSGDHFEPDDYFEVEEINDPNILRSPLLAAKLPLQEKPVAAKPAPPPEQMNLPGMGQESTPKTSGAGGSFSSMTAQDSSVTNNPALPNDPVSFGQPSGFPSAPPTSGGSGEIPKVEIPKVEIPKVEIPKVEIPKVELPKVEIPKVEMPRVEPPRVESSIIEPPRVEAPRVEAPRVEPPKTVGAFQNSNATDWESPPAAQMLRGSAASSNYLNKQKTPQIAESEAGEWQGADSANRPLRAQTGSRSSLLNRSLEEMETPQTGRVRRLSTPTVGILLAVLVLTKAYYLFSLGPSALAPNFFPFLVDQVAQLLVIICLIICA